jgi:hypothetical protein
LQNKNRLSLDSRREPFWPEGRVTGACALGFCMARTSEPPCVRYSLSSVPVVQLPGSRHGSESRTRLGSSDGVHIHVPPVVAVCLAGAAAPRRRPGHSPVAMSSLQPAPGCSGSVPVVSVRVNALQASTSRGTTSSGAGTSAATDWPDILSRAAPQHPHSLGSSVVARAASPPAPAADATHSRAADGASQEREHVEASVARLMDCSRPLPPSVRVNGSGDSSL